MSNSAVLARDLVLGYGSTVAFSASSIDIPSGQVTAVIGPNGSGKSTLLNAIAGLNPPLSGTLTVGGSGGNGVRCAYVLQTTKVNESLPVTVGEVVAMGRFSEAGWHGRLSPADRVAVSDAMERTGVADLARRQLHQLSVGQRQRVYLAQGLAQEHDLLLLDEPLTGIDLPTARAIDQVIHEETSRGCTVILTTHDLSEAQVASHVILLAGRVVAQGIPEEVLTVENLLDAYGSTHVHVQEDTPFLDDAAHRPVPGRHLHRDRKIHTEPDPTDSHPD